MASATTCERKETHTFYKTRDPHASPMHQLFSKHFDEFERVYEERYQKRYGPWRARSWTIAVWLAIRPRRAQNPHGTTWKRNSKR